MKENPQPNSPDVLKLTTLGILGLATIFLLSARAVYPEQAGCLTSFGALSLIVTLVVLYSLR